MAVKRRKFLTGLMGTAAGIAACSGQNNGTTNAPAGRAAEHLIPDNKFPVFSHEEYSDRLQRARQEMVKRGIDLLYVTQPSNMCYMHGYAATWYRAASTSQWPPIGGTAIHVDHEKMIHFDYADELGLLDVTSVVEDKRFFPEDRNNRKNGPIQFLVDELSAEGWLKGSRIGMEFWSFVPSRAVSERIEAVFREAGAKDVFDGSFVIRHIRRIKSPQEISYIEQGVQLADLGIRTAEEFARPGVMECEVYGEAIRAMYAAGGEVQGIPQGFNVRGLSHGYSGRNRIKPGDVGWLDLCGVVNRYHGNLCRSMYFREPDKTTMDAFAASAEVFDIVKDVARAGTDVKTLSIALQEHFKPITSRINFYFIGGYELGIAFPPDWIGEWVFDAIGGEAPGVFEAGMVTNFESIFYFEDEQGFTRDTSNINTVVFGENETRILGPYSAEPTIIT